MKKLCLILVFISISTTAYTDEIYRFAEIKCDQNAGKMIFKPFAYYNIFDADRHNADIPPPTQTNPPNELEKKLIRVADGETITEGHTTWMSTGTSKYECNIESKRIQIEIDRPEPSAQGECGGDPVAVIRIKENDQLVFKNDIEACFLGPEIKSIAFDRKQGWQLCYEEIGHPSQRNNPPKKCINYLPKKPLYDLVDYSDVY